MPRFLALALVLGTLYSGSLHARPSAESALECLRNTLPAALRLQQAELETFRGDQVLERLQGRLFLQRGGGAPGTRSRMMLQLASPEALAGAAYLLIETDDFLRDGMYVYLPAVRRVRRVAGTFASGALLGTSFSYFDFKQLAGAFGDFQPLSAETDAVEGRPAIRLRFGTDAQRELPYSGAEVWLDEEACLPVRVHFFEGEALAKRYTVQPAALRRHDGHWYASEAVFEDLGERRRTVLRMTGLQSLRQVPEGLFDPERFYRQP